jgi:two-component system sensor histidine kinase RegB
MRPEIECRATYQEPFQDLAILTEQTVAQAITNVLNNAADATLENGNKHIEITLASQDHRLLVLIDDQGKGISREQTEGFARVSSKTSGFGLGLLLSNASLRRFGGEVLLQNRPQGGARTKVNLPLQDLMIAAESSDGQAR